VSPGRPLVGEPPRPLNPLEEVWPAEVAFYRVHSHRFGPTAFNPGPLPRSRFAFFGSPPVPVLYAGSTEQAAVAESLLHDLPTAGGRLVPAAYENRVMSALTPTRDLRLAQFHSGGLRRLGARARNLTDTAAAHYSRTVRWAEAVHNDTDLDGVVWMSGRWNSSKAVVLFGDRVDPGQLNDVGGYARAFLTPEDFEWLAELCHQVDVEIIPPW